MKVHMDIVFFFSGATLRALTVIISMYVCLSLDKKSELLSNFKFISNNN